VTPGRDIQASIEAGRKELASVRGDVAQILHNQDEEMQMLRSQDVKLESLRGDFASMREAASLALVQQEVCQAALDSKRKEPYSTRKETETEG
jgi:hypothetical protein